MDLQMDFFFSSFSTPPTFGCKDDLCGQCGGWGGVGVWWGGGGVESVSACWKCPKNVFCLLHFKLVKFCQFKEPK